MYEQGSSGQKPRSKGTESGVGCSDMNIYKGAFSCRSKGVALPREKWTLL